MSPAGATEQLREFTWQSPLQADRYRVIVRRGTTVVWQTETTELRVAPPVSGTIERDVQYEWQVEALDREVVPGRPYSLLKEPAVQAVARLLRDRPDAAPGNPG